MALRWRYFLGGAIFAIYLPFLGAPVLPVIGGIALVGLWNLWQYKRERVVR